MVAAAEWAYEDATLGAACCDFVAELVASGTLFDEGQGFGFLCHRGCSKDGGRVSDDLLSKRTVDVNVHEGDRGIFLSGPIVADGPGGCVDNQEGLTYRIPRDL
jgi:hypothetical protein